jgi:hypothetical protein
MATTCFDFLTRRAETSGCPVTTTISLPVRNEPVEIGDNFVTIGTAMARRSNL